MGRLHPWSLDVRFYSYSYGDDGTQKREGVSGLAVGAHPFVFDEMFGLPLTDGASRDTETGHDQSPQTQFTDANGVARFCAGGSCGDASSETRDAGTLATVCLSVEGGVFVVKVALDTLE